MNKMIKLIWQCLLFSFCLTLLACSSASMKIQYYSLTAPTTTKATRVGEVLGSVGIGPIQLPETHQGDGIVTMGNGQIVLKSQQHLWAGDLKLAMSRVLADSLGQILNKDDVWNYPWDSRLKPDQQIFLTFEEFGGALTGELTLQVKCSLFDNQTKTVLATTKVRHTASPQARDYGEYVAELNRLLNLLGTDLAKLIGAS